MDLKNAGVSFSLTKGGSECAELLLSPHLVHGVDVGELRSAEEEHARMGRNGRVPLRTGDGQVQSVMRVPAWPSASQMKEALHASSQALSLW